MAEKKKSPATAPVAGKPKKSGILLKLFLVFFLLLLLAGGGFAAGVYLKFIDIPQIAQQYKLYDYPVIGQIVGKYFPKTATNFETVELPPETEPVAQQPVQLPPEKPETPAATAPDKDKVALDAKKDETKRISRLARLYGEMKPDEAVPILNQLDDATVLAILGKMEDGQVAKILSQFDPKRSARLTEDMLKGPKPIPAI
jgi:hypothetical protein